MEDKRLLTDEEINQAWTDAWEYNDLEKELMHKALQVAEAQLAKVDRLANPQVEALGQALMKLLVSINVVSKDATPTCPELIMATEEYLKSDRLALDRPERIEIAIRLADFKGLDWDWASTQQDCLIEADQILLLIGDIEKRERERIASKLVALGYFKTTKELLDETGGWRLLQALSEG